MKFFTVSQAKELQNLTLEQARNVAAKWTTSGFYFSELVGLLKKN